MVSYLPLTALEFFGALQSGLIFAIVTLGVYLSFRVLDFPDMTVNGSFPLGAAIAAAWITQGGNPWIGCALAVGGGACAGLLTAWFTTRWKILHLLSSILTMTALYSVNLRVMGVPNLTLFSTETIFTPLEDAGWDNNLAVIFLVSVLVSGVVAFLWWFLRSEIGLGMRATGRNPRMAVAHGVGVSGMIMAGVALSNAVVALSGAIYAQAMGFADVSMGADVIIVGLAAVLIGEAAISSRRLLPALISCVVGAIVYRLLLAIALNSDFIGLQPADLQLANAALIGLAMIFAQRKAPLRALRFKGGSK